MGMYTGVRCHVKIKEEFYPLIEKVIYNIENREDDNYDSYWKNLGYDFTDEFAKLDRADFIPNGSLSYMPWDDNDPEWKHNFINGEWKFQCSLKNYEEEIQTFMELVLANIVDEVIYFETFYEESEIGTIFTFKNGEWDIDYSQIARYALDSYYDDYGFDYLELEPEEEE